MSDASNLAPLTHEALEAERVSHDLRAEEGGGAARLARHRRLGRMSARERIDALLDKDTFMELGRHVIHAQQHESLAASHPAGDGLVCGIGQVAGLRVAVYAHDPTVFRGALGYAASRKLCQLLDMAAKDRLAVIAFADSDGVRVPEGIDAVNAYGDVIARTIALQGKVLQLTLVCGLCVGAAAYAAALTDVVGMIDKQSFMFITGPKVTQVVTGEDVTLEALGGPALHGKTTGSAHAVLDSENAGIAWLKQLLSFSQPALSSAAATPRDTPELVDLIPCEARKAYDMRKVLNVVFDAGSVCELQKAFAPNLLVAFARLGGRAVAVVASQPKHRAGCLDILSSRKGAWFVRLATALSLPIVTLVDVPGYVPGKQQEEGGILAFGAELLSAYGHADVPTICLVVRKSYGGANVLSFSANYRLALAMAAVAPMGASAAADVALSGAEDAETKARFIADWQHQHERVWSAAEAGYFDKVIATTEVRNALMTALAGLSKA